MGGQVQREAEGGACCTHTERETASQLHGVWWMSCVSRIICELPWKRTHIHYEAAPWVDMAALVDTAALIRDTANCSEGCALVSKTLSAGCGG